MNFTQGRVFASSPDEAAMMIRDKHQEYEGKLTILECEPCLGWYEYMLCLVNGNFRDNRG